MNIEVQLPQLNEIVFVCSKGRDRSPDMAESFPGSSYLEGGIESLRKQLSTLISDDEKISFLKEKFEGKKLVVIDKIAFSPIQKLVDRSGIIYSITDFSNLLLFREGLKSNFHWPESGPDPRQ